MSKEKHIGSMTLILRPESISHQSRSLIRVKLTICTPLALTTSNCVSSKISLSHPSWPIKEAKWQAQIGSNRLSDRRLPKRRIAMMSLTILTPPPKRPTRSSNRTLSISTGMRDSLVRALIVSALVSTARLATIRNLRSYDITQRAAPRLRRRSGPGWPDLRVLPSSAHEIEKKIKIVQKNKKKTWKIWQIHNWLNIKI